MGNNWNLSDLQRFWNNDSENLKVILFSDDNMT